MLWTRRDGLVIGMLVAFALPAATLGQVRQPQETVSAGEHFGPLSDVSRPVLDDSQAVRDGGSTIGDASNGSVRAAGSVRDQGTRSMLSGPVSDASAGPMISTHPSLASGAVAEASAGAVKHDIDSPLGERISEPLRELAPLQRQMRALREQAERVAQNTAAAPVAADGSQAAGAAADAAPAELEQADAEFVPETSPLNQDGDVHSDDTPDSDDGDPD